MFLKEVSAFVLQKTVINWTVLGGLVPDYALPWYVRNVFENRNKETRCLVKRSKYYCREMNK